MITPNYNFYPYILEKSLLNGAELITKERQRQIKEEGFSFIRDDEYVAEELVMAAMVYAASPTQINLKTFCQSFWPKGWDKSLLLKKIKDHRITQLIKAGALLAAEIDRLLRLELEEVRNQEITEEIEIESKDV